MAKPVPVTSKPTESKKGGKLSKKPEAPISAPIFLRKTFTMIDTCDSEIASWSENGLSFLVKDTDRFAAEVIPDYFKHNNFSSFVRQLNFYGFRKIKSDSVLLKDETEDTKYWRFRHEFFRQGRPELLVNIKKTNHNDAVDKQEIEALKSEMDGLKGQVASMAMEIQKLRSMVVGVMMRNQEMVHQSVIGDPACKKRKIEALELTNGVVPDAMVWSNDTVAAPEVASAPEVEIPSLTFDSEKLDALVPGRIKPLDPAGRGDSIGAVSLGDVVWSSDDDKALASIFEIDFEDEIVQNLSLPEKTTSLPAGSEWEKLRDALSRYPEELQQQFVSRMIAAIAEPEAVKKQVDALTQLAAVAAEEAKLRLAGTGISPTDKQSIDLAGAIFGAYLAKFAGRQQA